MAEDRQLLGLFSYTMPMVYTKPLWHLISQIDGNSNGITWIIVYMNIHQGASYSNCLEFRVLVKSMKWKIIAASKCNFVTE